MSTKAKKPEVASGGLKCSLPHVNAPGKNPKGVHYVEILDGILYVEHKQVREFKKAPTGVFKRKLPLFRLISNPSSYTTVLGS